MIVNLKQFLNNTQQLSTHSTDPASIKKELLKLLFYSMYCVKLFIGLIIISILALQTIQTAISPATLKAMAAIQAHKARALANALRARTHFNMARAKTNLGLIDHRIIRNSDDQLVDHDLEYDEENFPYLLEDYYEEINLPDTDEDIDRVLSSDSKLQQSQSELDNLVNGDEKIISLDSDVAYGYGENSNIDNNLQIPLNIGELDESNNLDCGVTTDNQDSSQTRREALPLGCERLVLFS